jgi:hypothetical protein
MLRVLKEVTSDENAYETAETINIDSSCISLVSKLQNQPNESPETNESKLITLKSVDSAATLNVPIGLLTSTGYASSAATATTTTANNNSTLGNATTPSGLPISMQQTIYKESNNEKIHTNSNRLKKFPNLNYSSLYHSLLNIIEIIPSIQTNQAGKFIINIFKIKSLFFS